MVIRNFCTCKRIIWWIRGNCTRSMYWNVQQQNLISSGLYHKPQNESLAKEGYYTNTILRRSANTRVVEAGIPREETMKTGHISTYVYFAQKSMETDIYEILSGKHSTNLIDLKFEKTSGSGMTNIFWFIVNFVGVI